MSEELSKYDIQTKRFLENTKNKKVMNQYSEIRKQETEQYNKILKDCGVFWAFDKKQFEENKTPLEDGDKYVSIECGGFMPKSN